MTCLHLQPGQRAALSAACGTPRNSNAGAVPGRRIRELELRFLGGSDMPDFEVLHAERVYPDGDPAAHLREQLQRLLREADRQGVALFVVAGLDGQRAQAVRKPAGVVA